MDSKGKLSRGLEKEEKEKNIMEENRRGKKGKEEKRRKRRRRKNDLKSEGRNSFLQSSVLQGINKEVHKS